MTNLKWIPAQDDFETTLSATYNGGVWSMSVFKIPSSTLPTWEYTYAVIEPWTDNMQVVKVSGWTSNPNTFIVSDVTIEKASGVNYWATSHPANSVVRISNNYAFWKDIQTAINSKAEWNATWDYTFSWNQISVSGDNARLQASGSDMTLSSNVTLKFHDWDIWPISLSQLADNSSVWAIKNLPWTPTEVKYERTWTQAQYNALWTYRQDTRYYVF